MEKKYWYQKQLRILQTVLREPDLQNYDTDKVVAYMKKTHMNCIVVNAGGIVDFFPNTMKLKRENRYIGRQDMLRDLTEACHRNGIRVMVRVDFRGVEKERYEERPDWFAKDREGNPQKGWADLYKPCYNSYYANEYAQEYIRNLMEQYPVDGIWENSVGFGQGACYCSRCRRLYKQETGKEIPTGSEYLSDEFSEYRIWKARRAALHLKGLRDTTKSFGKEKAFCAEIFGMFHASNAVMTGIDLYNAKECFDFLVSPAFQDGAADARQKWNDLIYAGSSIRFLKAIAPEKQAVLLYGNNGTRWRYVKAPKTETKIWLWEAAGAGGNFWNCMFNGQSPADTIDRRNAGLESEVYEYLEQHREILERQQPMAEVGIFYSKASRDTFAKDTLEEDEYGVFIKGAERILTEKHLPYCFVPDNNLTFEAIRELKVLLLPNAACMSEDQMEIIRKYVREGGGIVASYQTSLFDEKGQCRQDFGLGDLFGCSWTGMVKNTETDCYQKIREAHPLLADTGSENTEMLMNEGKTMLCTLRENTEAKMVCSYVPKIENQPPEFAWIKEVDTVYPTITVNQYGKGRCVYFSNQTDKLCITNGHEDFLNSMTGAIYWAGRDSFAIKTNAPGSVHIAWQRNAKEAVLALINTSSSCTRPIQELIPVHGLEVRWKCGEEPVEYEIWKGKEGNITVEQFPEKGEVSVKIGELKEFASVYLKAAEDETGKCSTSRGKAAYQGRC